MIVGRYELFQTNDGRAIYINNFLVDDKNRCPDYWLGWDEWVKKLQNTDFYDFLKRSELINEIKKNQIT